MSGCKGIEPYALRVLGDSMEPEFTDGEIIIIEPDQSLENGSFAIVHHEGELIFRQLCLDQGNWYLRPLNDSYPTLSVSGTPEIKGRIVSKSSGRGRQTKSYL